MRRMPAVPVLIVDDQIPFRRAAQMVMAATPGFEVVGEAVTGEEAVEQFEALDPGLVLMDINLPGHQRHRGDPADHRRRTPTRWCSCSPRTGPTTCPRTPAAAAPPGT